ncbi:TIGR03885 family FMN-dependent LLM class oxidoreductase [Nocardia donostiensis]|uniref:LLM class F420-dependent oxidoreductase n=1 Tax=Nocardia donostiensis TaxID=1538463 RepID=A0A1V2TMC3_9NOCA|nr:TIGR03885 family FMN-dependent LLM class oxidoreductase [Nocardia donostiensis]ONM50639.1 LLM class F420-dependent oxidoreductase [Nocardia donostiensis]OQS17134.1 LLM class F420-dependent oxidoreductase [Nocardia donostiensis]OQS18069.1 LLM class F420-dependent oxidoreductase [Nocardia donostiensis]
MATIGYHASHEQIAPAQLLADVVHAESAGFEAAMCSDHIEPWSHTQGHSGFAWSWLGAALASTQLRLGVVTCPGYRYHPTVVAHAIATLGAMFPGRFWAALGSGEYINEHVTGRPWPTKETRQQVLEECFGVIRDLLRGETVSRDGAVQVDRARLWDRPPQPSPLVVPALSPGTVARFAATADGFITVNQPRDTLREMISAYRDNGGTGTAVLQVHLSWAPTQDEAVALARNQWATNVFASEMMADLATPEEFEAQANDLGDELGSAVAGAVFISHDPAVHAQRIQQYLALGFDEIYLHHVGQDQERFIDTFGADVLQQLDRSVSTSV